MKNYIIKTIECKSILEVHEALAKALQFPDYYGKNLDALSDCLDEMDIAVKIEWQDYFETKQKLGKELEKISSIFLEKGYPLTVAEQDFQYFQPKT